MDTRNPEQTHHDYFQTWDIQPDELNAVLAANNSLRGMIKGYLAEEKLRQKHFTDNPEIDRVVNPDCHDRDAKGDWHVDYRGTTIKVEVKSLQSNSVVHNSTLDGDEQHYGQFQCDASDSREVTLPTGTTLQTTALVAGEFDVLAVNLFAFTGEWTFAFALNDDLPRVDSPSIDPDDRQHLLKGTMDITLPVEEPFTTDPLEAFDQVVEEKSDEQFF